MTEMVLPQFGMGMADGTIIAWHKAEGDRIALGEPLCDVEAAKTTVEVTAPCSGILQRIIVPAGANVPVNTVIALIGDTARASEPVAAIAPDDAPAFAAEPAPAAPAAKVIVAPVPQWVPPSAVRPGTSRAAATTQIEPRARRAARLHSIDLSVVIGTGPGGRIIECDVLNAARAPGAAPAAAIPAIAAVPLAAEVAASPAPLLAPAGSGVRQLHMRCDPWPLTNLLEQIAPYNGAVVPVEAALLRATALAAAQGPLGQGGIGLRADTGGVRTIDNPAGLSILALAKQLDDAEYNRVASPALIIEWYDEAWLSQVISLNPSVPACLSFGSLAVRDVSAGEDWPIVLTINEAGPSLVEAKQFLQSLHELFTHPMAILV